MPYCPHCAVELEPGPATCPLCGAAPQDAPPAAPGPYPVDEAGTAPVPRIGWPQIRRRIFYAATAVIVVGLASSVAVDLRQGSGFDWSPRVLISTMAGWCLLRWFLYHGNRPFFLLVRLLGLSALTVWLLDACDGQLGWSMELALPIVALVGLVFVPLFLAVFHFRISWASTAAWTLLCCGLFCLGLEAWIDHRTQPEIRLDWSIPVMLSMFPAALSMFFVRYHLMRVVNFEKLFHR